MSHLAIDLEDKDTMLRKGDTFECPPERVKKLGNSIRVLEDIPPAVIEEEAIPPDEPKKPKNRKTAV
ncbi:MAG: hypothetical protein Q8J68_03900 [Methanolobus sp.]|uniref:hypothetical protein n=1 Tax=Methanolobus sp. TaxID=1874737 RepID=UPI002730237E|nr:hypothetical protein [Methanolobus sp.]MDP2216415.1 hypothetical protein [Methanolobus sp.]